MIYKGRSVSYVSFIHIFLFARPGKEEYVDKENLRDA